MSLICLYTSILIIFFHRRFYPVTFSIYFFYITFHFNRRKNVSEQGVHRIITIESYILNMDIVDKESLKWKYHSHS